MQQPKKVQIWDQDRKLTADDLASILAQKSQYEKEKEYYSIRNRRMLRELELNALARDVVAGEKASADGRKKQALQ